MSAQSGYGQQGRYIRFRDAQERRDAEMPRAPFLFTDYHLRPYIRVVQLKASHSEDFEKILRNVPSVAFSTVKLKNEVEYEMDDLLYKEYTLKYTPCSYNAWTLNCCRQTSKGYSLSPRDDFEEWVDSGLSEEPEFRYITFVLNNPVPYEYRRAIILFEELSDEITFSDKTVPEINVVNLKLDTQCPSDLVDRYTNILCRIVETQPLARSINLSNCDADPDHAWDILTTILQGPASTRELKNLNITNFVTGTKSETSPLLTHFFSEFAGLEELFINYTSVNEQLLDALASNHCDSIRIFGFKVGENDPNSHVIDPLAWLDFRARVPNGQVEIDINSIDRQQPLDKILHPEIPLTFLNLSLKDSEGGSGNSKAENVLDHIIRSYHDTLETLCLKLDTGTNVFHGNIIRLMAECKKLKDIRMHACMPISKGLIIGQLRQENRISVTSCHIHFLCPSQSQYSLVQDELVPMFEALQEKGYDFHVYPCIYGKELPD